MNNKLTALQAKLKQRIHESKKPIQRVDPNINQTPVGAEDLIELLAGLEEMYNALKEQMKGESAS